MGGIREEAERQHHVIDMMLTMHCVLQDRYKRRAFIMDLVLLVASFLLLVLTLADEEFLGWIGVYPIEALQNGKIFAVVIFIISLFHLRVDWKGKVAKHSRARDELIRLKGETKKIVLNKEISSDLFEEYRQLCNLTMGGLYPIPEKQFNKLKAKHIRKVELSKMISSCPGCPIWALRIGLLVKGFYNACRRNRSGTKTEKEDGDS